jgi:hypothetical protein
MHPTWTEEQMTVFKESVVEMQNQTNVCLRSKYGQNDVKHKGRPIFTRVKARKTVTFAERYRASNVKRHLPRSHAKSVEASRVHNSCRKVFWLCVLYDSL